MHKTWQLKVMLLNKSAFGFVFLRFFLRKKCFAVSSPSTPTRPLPGLPASAGTVIAAITTMTTTTKTATAAMITIFSTWWKAPQILSFNC